MKKAFFALAIIACLAIPCGADVIGDNDAEVKTIAEPVLENILEGFKVNDYITYSRDFDATLKEAISEDKFYQTDKWFDNTLGPLVSKEYLGFLKQGEMTVILWKGKFEYSENDVLIKLVMSRRDDGCVVTGLWFQ